MEVLVKSTGQFLFMLYVLEGIAVLLLLFALWLFIKIEPSMLSGRMLKEPQPKQEVMTSVQNQPREVPQNVVPLGITSGQVSAFEGMSLSTRHDETQNDSIQTEEEITLWFPNDHRKQVM